MNIVSKIFTSRFLHFLIVLLFANFAHALPDERFVLSSNNGIYSLSIKLNPGNKIYWINPGDSGEPTRINLSNSSNLQEYELWWPFPKKDLFSSKIVNYVYEGGVEIPLVLSAKNNREPINLKAEISYVVCGDQCVPVSQVIERQIPAIQKNPI
ncbi:MAG: hypothetical protein KBC84_10265, partial [Proteobacteria bacterium]|nr:hypothetical protein [Pseudomonadota bacterium]